MESFHAMNGYSPTSILGVCQNDWPPQIASMYSRCHIKSCHTSSIVAKLNVEEQVDEKNMSHHYHSIIQSSTSTSSYHIIQTSSVFILLPGAHPSIIISIHLHSHHTSNSIRIKFSANRFGRSATKNWRENVEPVER